MAFCPNCGKEVSPPEANACAFCGHKLKQAQQSYGSGSGGKPTVGQSIDVGDVISESFGMLTRRPAVILPQLIPVIPVLLSLLAWRSSAYGAVFIVATIIAIVLAIIVSGAYPSIVKAELEGGKFPLADAMGKAYHKFWTLLVGGILVFLIIGLGTIALVVPGILFATWYIYFVPAIMLEDKGALEGMSASKEFGHDKKWSTFALMLVLLVAYIFAVVVRSVLSLASPVGGTLVYEVLSVLIGAWASVIISYTYISYGPSSVLPAAAASTPVQPVMQASAAPIAGTASYCPKCGTKLSGVETFCQNCGTKLR